MNMTLEPRIAAGTVIPDEYPVSHNDAGPLLGEALDSQPAIMTDSVRNRLDMDVQLTYRKNDWE